MADELVSIQTCVFQMMDDSEWEPGLALNEGQLGVIDRWGRRFTNFHDVRVMSGLSIVVSPYLAGEYVKLRLELMGLAW